MTEVYTGWHWISDDWKLRDGTLLEVGKTYHVPSPITMCERGLHWSREPRDALYYAPGSVCCRIEAWGETYHEEDKSVSEYRRVLSAFDATTVLHEFACRCAEHALRRTTDITDERYLGAIAAKRAWLRGDISDSDLAAAQAAAWDAAWVAALVAARAAALVAAQAAAWAAAQDAAREAQNRLLRVMLAEEMEG